MNRPQLHHSWENGDLQLADYAIFTTDIHYRIVEWNLAAEKLYGYCVAEAKGPLFLHPFVDFLSANGNNMGKKPRKSFRVLLRPYFYPAYPILLMHM